MGEDLQSRLRRLGVVRGTRNLKTASVRPSDTGRDRLSVAEFELDPDTSHEEGQPLEILLPGGHLVETDSGSCFVLDTVYPLSHRHGGDRLVDLTTRPLTVAATIAGDERLAAMDYGDLLFLDTETTGLAGAGTLAFMVGVGFFDRGNTIGGDPSRQAFVVRQYFLRDHADEPAMLQLLAELITERPGLVTFNGRTFDLPLLDGRYLINRLDALVGDLRFRPHLDLLPPSRRLWRSRLGSCALGSLEQNLLGLTRNHEDVPGWAIPGLYLDYLRSGDARPLLRVFYHNGVDMLSMVTLMDRILRQFELPDSGDHPEDVLSLARWQVVLGRTSEAEVNLRAVVAQDPPLNLYHRSLHHLGALLKRYGRREEAVNYWQQIIFTYVLEEQTSSVALDAHVELAKYYEWHQVELQTALDWTQRALDLLHSLGYGSVEPIHGELEHRKSRLKRKLD
jgi:uncharacterized protein YprB with RNaseH-like and TPR domain